jgi:hypothetical protein
MLGRTHGVTAPTGLPKVMESAVAHSRNPQGDSTTRSHYMALLEDYTPIEPWKGGAPSLEARRCPAKGTRQPATGNFACSLERFYAKDRI